jgi:hypothetical protein
VLLTLGAVGGFLAAFLLISRYLFTVF